MTDKQIKQRCKWIESHMSKIRGHVDELKESDNQTAKEVAHWLEENQLVNLADAREIADEIIGETK